MAGPNGGKKKLHTGRHASSIKRARQSEKRRSYNRLFLNDMRRVVKSVRTAIAAGDLAAAKTALVKAVPVVAKTAGRGLIPKTRASRFISRLTLAVNKLVA